MPSISGSLSGHEDFELGVPRTVPVTFEAEAPESGPADGLVFLIPGFGEDTDEAYTRLTRRQIAAKYNLVVVSVRAHCHFCRPKQSIPGVSVGIEIDPWSIAKAIGALVLQGDSLEGLKSADEKDTLRFLKGRKEHKFTLSATLVPPGQDYQNFGVLAALDHLLVLNKLIDDGVEFDQSNVVATGTSHGGYIAHLMQKFAPNTIAALIESSAYPETLPAYLGFGGVEYRAIDANIEFVCSTKTAWTNEVIGAPNYFGTDQARIRNVCDPDHLAVSTSQAGSRKTQFRMIHSSRDRLVNIDLKHHQTSMLNSTGFDAQLQVLAEADVDGKTITTLEHGLGIGLHSLFDRFYPTLSRRSGPTDRDLNSSLCFKGNRIDYLINHGQSGVIARISANSQEEAKSEALSA
ncbi:MAG: DUF2920 family protein [Rhodobiaceae bacterium]|nr:DUF2920 family protein [Rhodobiaceae bacterium]